MNVYSENEEPQGEEAYDSEEVSFQPDEGLQPPRPAGFILCCFHQQSTPDLCKFYAARLNTVLVFLPPYVIIVEKDGRCIPWSRSFRFPLCLTLC